MCLSWFSSRNSSNQWMSCIPGFVVVVVVLVVSEPVTLKFSFHYVIDSFVSFLVCLPLHWRLHKSCKQQIRVNLGLPTFQQKPIWTFKCCRRLIVTGSTLWSRTVSLSLTTLDLFCPVSSFPANQWSRKITAGAPCCSSADRRSMWCFTSVKVIQSLHL